MKHWVQRSAAIAAGAVVACTAATPAGAAAVIIQPGVSISIESGYCTLNWIYDGPGGVYGGTAAHCVSSVGDEIQLSTGSLGDPIQRIGEVAYIDDDLDYAFIQIDAGLTGQVSPALKGHPDMPTGVSTMATAATGDVMQFSGNGVGFHLLPQTQEGRQGILHSNDGTQHYIIGAVSPGDSGGPVADVTDGGKAFGIVNTVGVGINGLPYAGEGGVSLEGMLADAAADGFPVTLRTI